MQDTKRPALSRTWKAVVTYRECGTVTAVDTHTITLSREVVGGPLSATVDGQPVTVKQAVNLLEGARVEVLAEVLSQPSAPATIGKARAHKLHTIMGRLGLHDHYGIARRGAGLDECYSLAALTEQQARQVWAYLLNMFPLDAHRAAA
ncbi:hypothetical protein [Deinococcus fonticola]|uniref:hypothetical protein n=1 Tax=Deinococcus fonticola TaxID=2528713 RepID=UPI00107529A1|nr:hypothetical protein [Deinococcus fonticola]